MTISLGGLASGIDTTSLVTSLMGVAQQPLDQVNAQKAKFDSASTTISTISSKLASLKSAALALSTNVGFGSFAATSSDTAIVASATGSASTGSYQVSVEGLAQSQKTRSATNASSTTALNMVGSFDLAVGTGAAKTVNLLATDTLQDVATKISASGARVAASVMNDGTGFRLIVQGLDTGAANAFTITENNGTTLGFNNPGNTYGTAADARFTVDGMPATSATNQVTGVIAGVTLALTKQTTSTATVQVNADPTALKQKVALFVNMYNDFVNLGHNATGFGGNKATNTVLTADSAVRTALHKMSALMASAVPGATGKYSTLGSVGIKGNQDGTFTLDSTKFDAAMAADPTSVKRLFVTDTVTGSTGIMSTLMKGVDSLVTGSGSPIQARIDSLGSQSKRLAASAVKMQSRLDDYQAQLKKSFTNMDQLISKYKAQTNAMGSLITTTTSTTG
jgi:flagellar hook-associated protein 2